VTRKLSVSVRFFVRRFNHDPYMPLDTLAGGAHSILITIMVLMRQPAPFAHIPL
jgi:hypothetical protein